MTCSDLIELVTKPWHAAMFELYITLTETELKSGNPKILTSRLFADRCSSNCVQFHWQQFASISKLTTLHCCKLQHSIPPTWRRH